MSVPLFLSPQPFRPATSAAAGLMGLVPSPAIGQQTFVLRADATWVSAAAIALPDQAGASGKILSSDGVNALWSNSVGPVTSTAFTGPIGSTAASSGAFTALSATGQLTSTVAIGTAPFVVTSTTNVPNLNASSLNGATFAAPGTIGGGTAGAGYFTLLSVTGQISSTLATGLAPFSVASTTNVPNLNASSLNGATFAAPGAIGGGTAGAASFTEMTAASTVAAAITKTPVSYATGGNITIRFDLGSYGQIDLTTNAAFVSSSGMVRGRTQVLDLTNPSGGAFTLSWPGAWKLLNGALPTSIAAGQSIRFELNCGGTTEASIIAGYSLSGFVAGVLAPASGGTGVNNGSSTLTLAGNVAHAGAFTQTFTATANTALTLPTTGTLATLAGSEALSNKTSLNKVAITAPATGATLTIAEGATLTASATATVSGSNTGDQTISITGDVTASGSTGALTSQVTKINGTSLAGLATGILKNTTATGVPSIAVAGDFPTLNQNTSGNAATATQLQTARAINGVNFDGTAPITVTAAASTLSGTTLAAGVTGSSLTSVGTLAGLTVTAPISGSVTGSSGSTTGNAGTATELQTTRTIGGSNFNGSANVTSFPAPGAIGGTTPSTGAFTSVTALSDSGYQTVIGQLTTGDRVGISGQASGSGTALVFFDNAQTTFRPAVFDASSHSLKISGVEKAAVTSTGLQGAIGASNPSTVAATTITASSTIAATGAVSGSNLSGTNTGDQTITLTGGVTGTGTGSFAATVVTNANLTGAITSVGNATSIASQTGTGTKFVVDTSPTLITPNIGVATGTSLAAALNGSLGATTPSTGAFTTLSATGSITTSAGNLSALAGELKVGSGSKQLNLRTLSGSNRIDSYDNPVTTTVPLVINASTYTFQVADVTRGTLTSTGLNSTAIGATTPSTGAFTSLTSGNHVSTTNAVHTLGTSSNKWLTGFIQTISDGATATGALLDTSGTAVLHGKGTDWTVQRFYSSGNEVMNTSSTGLAVTGALSATGTSGNSRATLTGSGGSVGSQLRTNNDYGDWFFGIAGDTSGNALIYTANADDLIIYTNNSERVRINSAGALKLSAYGAGALTTDASGNVTAASDERIKSNIRPFSRGLSDIIAINPILHGYTEESGLDQTRDDYAGFLAQQVQPFIPEAIGVNADGMLSFSDRPVMAALVNAVKELSARLAALESK